MIMQTQLPPYTIRLSKRAKHISLRIYSGSVLEVIIPERRKQVDIDAFLNKNRDWIDKQAQRFTFLLPEVADKTALIEKIALPAVNQVIEIAYRPIDSAISISHKIEKNKIIFYGAITDFSVCVPVILSYIKKQAKRYLADFLDELTRTTGLSYQKLSIRSQKTVWGSCTAQKNIQLNYKILFLPTSLARYILIHELCHTVHLNHSRAFWKLVSMHVSDYREQVRALREADCFLPKWLCVR